MKHRHPTKTMMRRAAECLINERPREIPRLQIAREVFALFRDSEERYASLKSFYLRLLGYLPHNHALAYLASRRQANQTPVQVLMRDVAVCLVTYATRRRSVRKTAYEVMRLFRGIPGAYRNAEAFYSAVTRLHAKNKNA